MSFKIVLPREELAADAGELLLACVDQEVELQLVLSVEPSVALLTFEPRLLFGADPGVSVSALLGGELLLAAFHLTAVRELSCVLPEVGFQLRLSDELFVANVAGISSRIVKSPVTAQRGLHDDLSALVTDYRLPCNEK